MEYLLYQRDYHIAPYFECFEDEYIDINKYPFTDQILKDNRDIVIGVLKYLKTNDTNFLSKNIDLLINIFNYLGCGEGKVLKILTSENYKKAIDTDNNIELKKYHQELYHYYYQTINMFSYLGIYEKCINVFKNKHYVRHVELNYKTEDTIFNYTCRDVEDLKNPRLQDIKILKLYCNKPLQKDTLPKSIVSLYLEYYDHPIEEGVFPETLEQLHMGFDFNQPIKKGTLPNSITKLNLGRSYNQPIEEGVLPNSLEKMIFGCSYGLKFTNILPESLITLEVGSGYRKSFDKGSFPKSLKVLIIKHNYNREFEPGVLPESLIHLEIGNGYNQPFKKGVLPNSLECLKIGKKYNQPFEKDVLPKSLKKLVVGGEYTQSFEGVLPESLEKLVVGKKHIQLSKKDTLAQ